MATKQACFTPTVIAKAAQYTQVEKLLIKRNSQCSTVRATGVALVTVAKLVKKARAAAPLLPQLRRKKAQKKRWEVIQLDEICTSVGSKAHKVWLWLAVERASRRIVAWVLGNRSAQTAQRLWQALSRRYRRHCLCFTDLWDAYAAVLPRWRHRPWPKCGGQTRIIEAINCSVRQRCGVLVRKSYSLSKSLALHTARIKSVINNYHLTLNLNHCRHTVFNHELNV